MKKLSMIKCRSAFSTIANFFRSDSNFGEGKGWPPIEEKCPTSWTKATKL